jgi:hypothetical protein
VKQLQDAFVGIDPLLEVTRALRVRVGAMHQSKVGINPAIDR